MDAILETVVGKGGYWIIISLMMTGLYITFAATNLIKRMVGLSVFQTSVFLFYITLSKVAGGTAPILYGKDYPKKKTGDGHDGDGAAEAYEGASAAVEEGARYVSAPADGGGYGSYYGVEEVYSNPLPHVLILTAIVVGVATLSVGLAIVVRIRESYGTIEADEIRDIDMDVALAEEQEDAGDKAGAPA